MRFSVDAALFRELGERLVGKPHIALAELIKNSYDADASVVHVDFGHDRIEVSDDGNGMTPEEFESFWMRVGSPHKQEERTSRRLGRPMTGSKGVGRLAVQFLAGSLELRSTAHKRGSHELRAVVRWADAIGAGDLTQATVQYDEAQGPGRHAGGATHGTTIVLTDLQHRWTSEELSALAREIWWLRPPFESPGESAGNPTHGFDIQLEHGAKRAEREFESQMSAALDGWSARLLGRLSRSRGPGVRAGRVALKLEFEDGDRHEISYEIPDCAVARADFEVRVYTLSNRQRTGVRVEDARRYFKQFGGVHVYDGGFHLPYYGPDTDWLRVEIDHSHRLSKSQLLPAALQVANGLNNLPTQSRLFGVVHVDTAAERAGALEAGRRDYLKIQVSRDRLVDNRGFEQLRDAVRWALDYYAMQETRRKLREAQARRPVGPVPDKVRRVGEVLNEHREQIPKRAFHTLRTQVNEAVAASESETQATVRRMGLLGALATAGVAALAHDRNVDEQLNELENLASRLAGAGRGVGATPPDPATAAEDIRRWVRRAREARSVFANLASEESRVTHARFRARSLIEDIRDHMRSLLDGASVEASGVDPTLRLPQGTVAEWTAVFQNVFANAAAATRDSASREIIVSSRTDGPTRSIVVQDAGTGVDLATAERLFEPFERVHQRNGQSGAGLGLTIARMVATSLHCRVGFTRPDTGFRTAFELSWKERG